MNLTPKEKRTVKAVFAKLLEKPYSELNRFLGNITIDEMKTLYSKLRYEKYCDDHDIRFEDMTEIDFMYADDEMSMEETKEQNMRRYDTFTPDVKASFFTTLEKAEDEGTSRFVCKTTQYSLPCRCCPFGNSDIHEIRDRTASEWLAWAAEEIEEYN